MWDALTLPLLILSIGVSGALAGYGLPSLITIHKHYIVEKEESPFDD